jgi:hypothetical protein
MFNDPEVAEEQKYIPSKLVADAQGRVAIQVSVFSRKSPICLTSSFDLRVLF